MQTANALLALGEDMANTVPKKGITPAEAMLLAAIHGENAVHGIELLDKEVDKSNRDLLNELNFKYGRARDSENNPVIRKVFPTSHSPVPKTFAEIGLADANFTPASIEKMNDPAKKARAAKKPAAKKQGPEDQQATENEDDGVQDMPKSGNALG